MVLLLASCGNIAASSSTHQVYAHTHTGLPFHTELDILSNASFRTLVKQLSSGSASRSSNLRLGPILEGRHSLKSCLPSKWSSVLVSKTLKVISGHRQVSSGTSSTHPIMATGRQSRAVSYLERNRPHPPSIGIRARCLIFSQFSSQLNGPMRVRSCSRSMA